jgi:hypothetical protein
MLPTLYDLSFSNVIDVIVCIDSHIAIVVPDDDNFAIATQRIAKDDLSCRSGHN